MLPDMTRRIITPTTDFGTADHFSGTMKGAILGIHPAAQIVDITHQVVGTFGHGGYDFVFGHIGHPCLDPAWHH